MFERMNEYMNRKKKTIYRGITNGAEINMADKDILYFYCHFLDKTILSHYMDITVSYTLCITISNRMSHVKLEHLVFCFTWKQ